MMRSLSRGVVWWCCSCWLLWSWCLVLDAWCCSRLGQPVGPGRVPVSMPVCVVPASLDKPCEIIITFFSLGREGGEGGEGGREGRAAGCLKALVRFLPPAFPNSSGSTKSQTCLATTKPLPPLPLCLLRRFPAISYRQSQPEPSWPDSSLPFSLDLTLLPTSCLPACLLPLPPSCSVDVTSFPILPSRTPPDTETPPRPLSLCSRAHRTIALQHSPWPTSPPSTATPPPIPSRVVRLVDFVFFSLHSFLLQLRLLFSPRLTSAAAAAAAAAAAIALRLTCAKCFTARPRLPAHPHLEPTCHASLAKTPSAHDTAAQAPLSQTTLRLSPPAY